MKKNLKIIAAFAIGATAGSVLGMLLMPGKHEKPAGEKAGETKTGKKKSGWRPGIRSANDNEYAKAEVDELL